MKKNRIALLILFLLALVAAYFIFTNKGGTIKEELRDFAVTDTGAVDKIFMADKAGNEVLLERKSASEWTVNGSDPARQDGINMLLSTMILMEVRSPVGKAARDFIIKDMSAKGTKVEIYQHGALFKTYYVGGPTQDQLGTFMYLQNSTVPFVMHIPGFDGYLSPRFITREADWKTKSIFAFQRGEMALLTLQNNRRPDQSFSIKKTGDGRYELARFPSGEVQAYQDSGTIYAYVASYQFINYEKPLLDMPKQQLDSVLKAGPSMIIECTDAAGKKTSVSLYIKPADPNMGAHYDEQGHLLPMDPDRLIAKINQDTSLVLVQYFSFDKLMKTLDELKKGAKM